MLVSSYGVLKEDTSLGEADGIIIAVWGTRSEVDRRFRDLGLEGMSRSHANVSLPSL